MYISTPDSHGKKSYFLYTVLVCPVDGNHFQRGGSEGHQAPLCDPELHQPQCRAVQGVRGGRVLHSGGEAIPQELSSWTCR